MYDFLSLTKNLTLIYLVTPSLDIMEAATQTLTTKTAIPINHSDWEKLLLFSRQKEFVDLTNNQQINFKQVTITTSQTVEKQCQYTELAYSRVEKTHTRACQVMMITDEEEEALQADRLTTRPSVRVSPHDYALDIFTADGPLPPRAPTPAVTPRLTAAAINALQRSINGSDPVASTSTAHHRAPVASTNNFRLQPMTSTNGRMSFTPRASTSTAADHSHRAAATSSRSPLQIASQLLPVLKKMITPSGRFLINRYHVQQHKRLLLTTTLIHSYQLLFLHFNPIQLHKANLWLTHHNLQIPVHLFHRIHHPKNPPSVKAKISSTIT